MRIIEVVCGAIVQNGCYLIAKRGMGIHEDTWEFPGGKVEAHETQVEAIVRELKEELGVDVQVKRYLTSICDQFDETTLHVHAYICEIIKGTPTLHVHKEMVWVSPTALSQYAFRKADMPIIQAIRKKER